MVGATFSSPNHPNNFRPFQPPFHLHTVSDEPGASNATGAINTKILNVHVQSCALKTMVYSIAHKWQEAKKHELHTWHLHFLENCHISLPEVLPPPINASEVSLPIKTRTTLSQQQVAAVECWPWLRPSAPWYYLIQDFWINKIKMSMWRLRGRQNGLVVLRLDRRWHISRVFTQGFRNYFFLGSRSNSAQNAHF